jgi:hypothetical protein
MSCFQFGIGFVVSTYHIFCHYIVIISLITYRMATAGTNFDASVSLGVVIDF